MHLLCALTDEGGQQVGHSHGGATLHWGPFFEANQYERSSGSIDDETLSSDFHVYKCEWTATGITYVEYVTEPQLLKNPRT